MVTLERLMEDYSIDTLDLLKLDCEGAEWDILPAAERVLPRVRQICMEFHCERGWTAAKLARLAARARLHRVAHSGPLERAAVGEAVTVSPPPRTVQQLTVLPLRRVQSSSRHACRQS